MVGEDFNRADPTHDHEDFRWIIDFETDLNEGNEVDLKPPEVPVTEMYMSKPRLYADPELMSLDEYQLVNIDPAANEDPKDFGFFTEGIKADITCQNGGAVILRVDGPQGFQVHLPHGMPKPHQIKIDNICPPKANENEGQNCGGDSGTPNDDPDGLEPTDFRLYYSLIEDTKGKKFDLKATGDEHGEGAVCNGSTLGKRDSLFPLPGSTS
jgi:hypothetical protein